MPIFTPIPYEDFVADVRVIAAALTEDRWQPDFLIGIGRGGLVPGAYLSHATGINLLSVDHSAKVHGFGDQLLEQLAAKSGQGRKLLVIDDINDSGRTICYLREAIDDAGGVSENVRFAVLLNNVRSAAQVDYWSRTIDRSITKDWFVFPWEAMAPATTHEEDAAEVPERIA
ncbi:phosphoribosyltransferase [Sphingomonas colocasiae]|uniref:Phosphoribosyltransferase domain-containing protein n=1 Tax=Sphingomonas colocasiae TaxID=1848973 RepID=A0ABS7PP50_9SPHN|nr:phosphoribosyltransferase family protein [Sphingomonas colocasiae]MBY8823087.1 phosphoribosyltransferase domain-containing protein [Sphingomonas colocasiae]